jgi:hypothetical protein
MINQETKVPLKHLPQFPNNLFPIYIYWDSPISCFVNIEGVVATVPQHMSLNSYMEGGSHMSVRENMAKKW